MAQNSKLTCTGYTFSSPRLLKPLGLFPWNSSRSRTWKSCVSIISTRLLRGCRFCCRSSVTSFLASAISTFFQMPWRPFQRQRLLRYGLRFRLSSSNSPKSCFSNKKCHLPKSFSCSWLLSALLVWKLLEQNKKVGSKQLAVGKTKRDTDKIGAAFCFFKRKYWGVKSLETVNFSKMERSKYTYFAAFWLFFFKKQTFYALNCSPSAKPKRLCFVKRTFFN